MTIGLGFSIPGARPIPAWLNQVVSADTATRISVHWYDQHWNEVVRDTPQETWVALAQHPNSSLHFTGNAFQQTDDDKVWATFGNSHRQFLGLLTACWTALRAELATEAQRQELLDAEENLRRAQERLRNACSAVPTEVVAKVLRHHERDE